MKVCRRLKWMIPKAAAALLLLAPDRKRNLKCAVVQQLPSGRDFIQILSGYMRVCMWGTRYTLLLVGISAVACQ